MGDDPVLHFITRGLGEPPLTSHIASVTGSLAEMGDCFAGRVFASFRAFAAPPGLWWSSADLSADNGHQRNGHSGALTWPMRRRSR